MFEETALSCHPTLHCPLTATFGECAFPEDTECLIHDYVDFEPEAEQKKRGRKCSSTPAATKRAAQNRHAQEKRKQTIEELQIKVKLLEETHAKINAKLTEENNILKEKVIQLKDDNQKLQIEKLQVLAQVNQHNFTPSHINTITMNTIPINSLHQNHNHNHNQNMLSQNNFIHNNQINPLSSPPLFHNFQYDMFQDRSTVSQEFLNSGSELGMLVIKE